MLNGYESPYEEACVCLAAALWNYFEEISTLGPVHKGTDDFSACLSEIFAPCPLFTDRSMTEDEDRILRAHFGRVTARFEKLANLAKHLNARKGELLR